jgi:hypothetical protein
MPQRLLHLALVVPLLAMFLAGCGGETPSNQFSCTLYTSPCIRGVSFTNDYRNGTYSQWVWGVSTQLLQVPIICDSTCLATRGASIYNFVELSDDDHLSYIRLGYGVIGQERAGLPGTTAMSIFVEYTLPLIDGSASGGVRSGSGRYTLDRVVLSTTGGQRRFRWFQIFGAYAPPSPLSSTSTRWMVCLSNELAPPNEWSSTAPGHTTCSNVGATYGVEDPSVFHRAFIPTKFTIGQQVYAARGYTAELATFANTKFAIRMPASIESSGYSSSGTYYPGGYSGYSPTEIMHFDYQDFTYIRHNGTEVTFPPGAPLPYTGWLLPPDRSSNGGMYYTECCTPLHR